MDGKHEGKRRMEVVAGGRDDLDEEMSDARALFDNDVMNAVRELASGRINFFVIDVGQADSDGDDLINEVCKLIYEETDVIINWSGLENFCPDDVDGDILVWVERGYSSPWKVVVAGKYDLPEEMYSVGGIFVFNSEEYLSKNEFSGRRYPDILSILEEKHGRESKEVKDIDRFVVLTRMLIYTVVSPIKKRKQLFRELTELCVSLGPAAKAVVADFIDMYLSENDDIYDEDEELIGDDPDLCVGMSGCPFKSLF